MAESQNFSAKVTEITSALRSLDTLVEQVDRRLDSLGEGLGTIDLSQMRSDLRRQIDQLNQEFDAINAGDIAAKVRSSLGGVDAIFSGLEAKINDLRYALNSVQSARINVSVTGESDIINISNAVDRLANSLDRINSGNLATAANSLRSLIRDLDRIGETDYNTVGLDNLSTKADKAVSSIRSLASGAENAANSMERLSDTARSLSQMTVGDLGMNRLSGAISSAREELAYLKQEVRSMSTDDILAMTSTRRSKRPTQQIRAEPEEQQTGFQATRPHPRDRAAGPIFDEDVQFSRATTRRLNATNNPIPVSIERTSERQKIQPITVAFSKSRSSEDRFERAQKIKINRIEQNVPQGRDPQELAQTFRSEMLRFTQSESRLAIRISQTNLGRVLTGGEFKNTHKLGEELDAQRDRSPLARIQQRIDDITSGRIFRRDKETAMLGLPRHAKADQFPNYGYFEPIGGKTQSVMSYGNTRVFLKPDVLDRTSVTVGDSFYGDVIPSPVKNPSITSLPTDSIKHVVPGYADKLRSDLTAGRLNYVEGQIFGNLGPKDIASVDFDSAPTARMMDELRKQGIPFTVDGKEFTDQLHSVLSDTVDHAQENIPQISNKPERMSREKQWEELINLARRGTEAGNTHYSFKSETDPTLDTLADLIRKFGKSTNLDTGKVASNVDAFSEDFGTDVAGTRKVFKSVGQTIKSFSKLQSSEFMMPDASPELKAVFGGLKIKDFFDKFDLGSMIRSAIDRISGFIQNIKQSISGSMPSVGQSIGVSNSRSMQVDRLVIENADQLDIHGANGGDATTASLSLSKSFDDQLNTISSVFSKFTFGLSQGGGIFNSFRELRQGTKAANTPQGILDIAGGSIGIAHGIQSLNSYFGLNLLPKSIEGTFNQRRSETLADIIEALVKVKTGYSPERATRSRLNPDDKVNVGGESTGSRLRRETSRRNERGISDDYETDVSESRVYKERLESMLNEQQLRLSKAAREAFQKAFGSTSIGQHGEGLFVGDSDLAKKYFAALYGEGTTSYTDATSGNVPLGSNAALRSQGKLTEQITYAQRTSEEDVSSTIAHEITHALTELKSSVDPLFARVNGAGIFMDSTLEKLRKSREFSVASDAAEKAALTATSFGSDRYNIIAKSVASSKDELSYHFDPKEIYANVGQALISGKKEFENLYRSIYGADLFNSVANDLKRISPDVFSDEVLAATQANFKAMAQSIEAQFQSQLAPVKESVAAPFKEVKDELTGALQDVSDVVKTQIESLFGPISGLGDKISPYLSAITPDLIMSGIEDDGSSASTLRTILLDEGKSLIDSVTRLVQNPASEQNRQAVMDSLGDVDIQNIVSRFLNTRMEENVAVRYRNMAANAIDTIRGTQGNDLNDLLDFGRYAYAAHSDEKTNIYPEMSDEIYEKTGKAIKNYTTQSMYDLEEGITRVTASAELAGGAMVEFSGHIDAFGKFVKDQPEKDTFIGSLGRQFRHELPQEIAEEAVYGTIGQVQQMFQTIVDTQDELNEIALLFNANGKGADTLKRGFIQSTVQESSLTGQGYEEALQTNIKNAKLFSFVQDPAQRLELSSQMSRLQLGAQTVFDLPQEAAIKNIPAIFSQLNNGLTDIKDPSERARVAMEQLSTIFDKLTVAQRMSAADGQNMVEIFSELSPSMKKLGMTADELMSLSAVSDVAIAETPEETSNILKILLERTQQAGKAELEGIGIDTTQGSIDIFKQIYALSQDPTRKSDYETAINAIGSQAKANEAAKVVQAVGTNYDRVFQTTQGVQGNEFETILARKIDAFVGSFNALQSAAARFLDTFLNGTGVLDAVNATMRRFGEGLSLVSDLFDKFNQGGLLKELATGKGIAGFNVADIARFKYIDQLGVQGNWNPVEPLAKLINKIDVGVRGQAAATLDFRPEASRNQTMTQYAARIASTVLDRGDQVRVNANTPREVVAVQASRSVGMLDNALQKVSAAADRATGNVLELVAGFAATDSTVNRNLPHPEETIRALQNEKRNTKNRLDALAAQNPLVGPQQRNLRGLIPNPIGTRNVAVNLGAEAIPQTGKMRRSYLSRALDIAAQTGEVRPGISPIVQSRGFQALAGAGQVAGAIAMPVATDLMLGGLGKDNLTNVGMGLAGAFAGAMVGGPYGAVVGYTLAKNFSEAVDVPGIIGTSEAEKQGVIAGIQRDIGLTKEEKDQQVKFENDAANKINTQITSAYRVDELRGELGRIGGGVVSAEEIRKLYEDRQKGINTSTPDIANLTSSQRAMSYNSGNSQRVGNEVLDVLSQPKYKEVLDLILNRDVQMSDVGSDLPEALSSAASSRELIDAEVGAQIRQAQEEANEAQIQAAESAQELYTTTSEKTEMALGRINALYESKPYMGTTYGGFGSAVTGLEDQYLPQLSNINLTDEQRQRLQAQYDLKRGSAMAVSETLGTAIPLSKSLGLSFSDTDLAAQLYGLGAEGQGQVMQRLRPIAEADQFTKTYEAKQSELSAYANVDLAKEENAQIAARVAQLQQELTLQAEKYQLSKQIVDSAKAEGNVVKDTIAAVAANQPRQRVIRQGTPAQFVAPDIFDASELSTQELRDAIGYAREKQNKLIGMNAGYKDVFAKDQFMLESGGQFKGVAGISQGFVQEYLQQQQQRMTPPDMVDLSKLSDEKRQQTVARAYELQNQAVALAPDMAKDLEKQRLLLLGKNNQLLMETGLSQEYLRIAMDENTSATEDTLRGHYNLPGNYRPPTVWDYYNEGGREAGDVNFPGMKGQEGMVPISTAQKIAEQMLNSKGGAEGPDLSALGDTTEAGARPLFYPNPGTPSIIEQLDQLTIQSAKSDEVSIQGSSVYINGKDMTAYGQGGGREADWEKGMLQELAAQSVMATSNGNEALAKRYDSASEMIKSDKINTDTELQSYLNSGGQAPYKGPSGTGSAFDPSKAQTSLDELRRASENTSTKSDRLGTSMAATSENAQKLITGLAAANAVIPGFTQAILAPVQPMAGLSKQIASTIQGLQKLDASKIQLNVQVNINGTSAQVTIQPSGQAPRAATGGSGTASLGAGAGTRRTIGQ